MMLNSIERFEFSLSEMEKGLNIVGYVPGLNILSGGLRCTLGKIQLIAGLALGYLALLASGLTTNPIKRKKFETISNEAFEHAKHGIANIARGLIESLTPFHCGGFLCLLYDIRQYRMEYPGEKKGQETFGSQKYSLSVILTLSQELISIFE